MHVMYVYALLFKLVPWVLLKIGSTNVTWNRSTNVTQNLLKFVFFGWGVGGVGRGVLKNHFYKTDNSPKDCSSRKEHLRLDVWIYLPETSECHRERKWIGFFKYE